MDLDPATRLVVLVAHSEPLIAAGVRFTLQQWPDVEVLPGDAARAAAVAADVVVTTHEDALHRARQGRTRSSVGAPPAVRLLVITAHEREHEVREALEAGIHGYLLASCPTDELLRCVHALARGSRYLGMAVAQRMADSMTREALTARELDVLRMLVRGECNKAIAQALDIAVGTVKAHVKAIMGKLDARSRTHAVAIANERGLVNETIAEAPTRRAMLPPVRRVDRVAA